MELKTFLTVFGAVFVAELGDKTQLATLLFAAERPEQKLIVFLGAALALVAASAIGVLAGGVVSQYLGPRILTYVAGLGFIAIGAWVLVSG